jgi:hypothetical protein
MVINLTNNRLTRRFHELSKRKRYSRDQIIQEASCYELSDGITPKKAPEFMSAG